MTVNRKLLLRIEELFAAKLTEKDALLRQALDALEELDDLVDSIRSGEYTPDSFTTQPVRSTAEAIRQHLGIKND